MSGKKIKSLKGFLTFTIYIKLKLLNMNIKLKKNSCLESINCNICIIKKNIWSKLILQYIKLNYPYNVHFKYVRKT